ncbi:glycosyl hydrolase family 95 catalytic domain-containing protein [Micromonospora sp. NPDC050397]|uniref:glycosyl hydrolase family 95 catalytic domain-containing protein n=1 Tax=Micromonospora sp. NPDC050397 TaxID=3364279 RepID=UPI00384C686C
MTSKRQQQYRRSLSTALILTVAGTIGVVVPAPAQAAPPTPEQQWAAIQQLLAGVKGRWTNQAYSDSVSRTMPNTALLGNGDVGVTSGGGDGFKTFYLSKGNFWAGNPNPSLGALGGVTIAPVTSTPSGNLALGSVATASSAHPSFPASRAVNGQWGSGYEGWVSEVGKPQTITLDLGAVRSIGRYVIRHDAAARPNETANTTKNFVVQIGDGSAWTTVDTVTNNVASVTDRSITATGGRYVRVTTSEPTQGTTPDSINNPRARFGQIELYAPGSTQPPPSGPFLEEQNTLTGEITTSMTIGGVPVAMKTWTAANDNLVVTQIQSLGSTSTQLRAQTWSGSQDAKPGFTNTAGVTGSTTWASRTTPTGSRWVSRAALATRLVGATPVGTPTASGATATQVFNLQPGQTIQLVTGVAGGGQNPADPTPAARGLADGQSAGSLGTLYNQHLEWWKQFWLRSYVDLDDDTLERFYYGSQYLLGSSSRAGKTAPGLYGIWATTDYPMFSGDMHLNYNFMANFYGTYSSNRADLALPYHDLLLAYVPEARRRAQQDLRRVNPSYVNSRFPSGGVPSGLLFPVGIAPFGATADDNYHQQVANSLFAATQFIAYYDYTQDRAFLTGKAYPFLKEVAAFFTHYLEFDAASQRYRLYAGPHEGTWSRNSSPDIGLLKYLLSALIDASVTLGVDAGDRATWTQIRDRLPATPTTTHNGQTVFALADPGTITGPDTRNIRPGDNTVNLEFIHPGEVLGINSPAADRQIAINTLNAMNSWGQDNSFPKVFTQAARVGYPAQSLIDQLKNQINTKMTANLRIGDPFHGLEKAGATEAVNNLLLQSDGGVLRLFPVWPSNRNASFVKLREKDALVVSSAFQAGRVTYVDITSEAGRTVRLQHPWPGQTIVVGQVGGGTVAHTVSGNVITFPTQAGATYRITAP